MLFYENKAHDVATQQAQEAGLAAEKMLKPGKINASVFDLLTLSGSAAQTADAIIAAVFQRGSPDRASVIVIDLQQVEFTPIERTIHPAQSPV